MQREGLLEVARKGDSWEVAASRLDKDVVRRPPPPPSAEGSGGERWIMG